MKAKNGKEIINIVDPLFLSFLGKQKPKTKKTYETMFRRVMMFDPSITGQGMIDEKEKWERTKIFEFHQWLLTKGYSENYVKSACGMVRGFYAWQRIPFVFTQSEKRVLNEANRKTEDFLFSKEELKKMWDIADLNEKWVICNKSLGMRIEDFARITFGDLRSIKIDEDAPVYFGDFRTAKAHVTAHPFLDSDCVPIVKQLIELNKDKSNNEKVFNRSNEQGSYTIQQLVKKAHIETGSKTVRFHNLRKFCNDRLKNHMASEKADLIIGHSIGKTQRAYIYDEVREAFARAMTDLVLNGNGTVKMIKEKVTSLDNTVENLVRMLSEKDKVIDDLKTQLAQNSNTMNKMLSLPTIAREMLKQKEKVPF